MVQEGGRWNSSGGHYAQYFSLSRDAAWAEYIRAQEIRTASEALYHSRRMWVARIHETRVADLSTPARAVRCGIDPKSLVGPHPPCREIADGLVELGYCGVVTPSAALPGALSLTLFGERIDEQLTALSEFSTQRIDPMIVEVKPLQGPCSPPGVVVDVTRHKAEIGYSEWPEEGAQRPT